MSRLRLVNLPFLAATLAMALALILPWIFTSQAADAPGESQVSQLQPDRLQLAAQDGPAAPAQP